MTRTTGIPNDLSVVGFDDLPITAVVDPPMTTVRQPGLELAITLTVRKSAAPPDSYGR